MTPWNTGQKIFSKKTPQNTFGHSVMFLDNFGTLKLFLVFFFNFCLRKLDSNFSSPENWIHIFEFGILNSQFYVQNIWSRIAYIDCGVNAKRMSVECCVVKLNSYFSVRKTKLLFSSPQNWTHIFKSRKSEKPCIEHSAKKNRKNRHKACSKHVWTLLETI